MKWFYISHINIQNLVHSATSCILWLYRTKSQSSKGGMLNLTKNQIEYLKHKETQRANLSQESLTRSRDQTSRELGFANLAELGRHNIEAEHNASFVAHEQMRHNLESESLTRSQHQIQRDELSLKGKQLEESIRHNLSVEDYNSRQLQLSRDTLNEQQRHSIALEDIQRGQLAESVRHNTVSELEVGRHNVVSEQQTGRRLDEERRANQARETETARHNKALESLTSRQIGLGYAQVGLGYSQLSETERANRMREQEQHLITLETQRSNLARESESRRSNIARETETARSNLARENETHRANVMSEKLKGSAQREAKRANYAQEDIARTRNAQGWVTSISRAVESGTEVSKTLIPLIGGIIS